MLSATRILNSLMWLWVIILIVSGVQVAVWWLDRRPPFELLSYTAPPVQAGGVLRVDGLVRRDLDRDCSVVASRNLMDSSASRYEVSSMITMTPAALRKMDAAAPGEIHLSIPIPPYMPPGRADLVTVLAYRCNPLQDIMRPIDVQMRIPFQVLP